MSRKTSKIYQSIYLTAQKMHHPKERKMAEVSKECALNIRKLSGHIFFKCKPDKLLKKNHKLNVLHYCIVQKLHVFCLNNKTYQIFINFWELDHT